MTDTAHLSAVSGLVDRFNAAWNSHELDAALAMCSEDCVFESTSPAPDGTRHVGLAALREAWAPIFADTGARFTVEESFATDERVTQRWRYDWDGGHVRGIDQIDVSDGVISGKYAYVKG